MLVRAHSHEEKSSDARGVPFVTAAFGGGAGTRLGAAWNAPIVWVSLSRGHSATEMSTTADNATHQIITNDDDQFVVWPDNRRLPAGWRYVGRSGTRAELRRYLHDMLVETAPAPLLVKRARSLDSRWGN